MYLHDQGVAGAVELLTCNDSYRVDYPLKTPYFVSDGYLRSEGIEGRQVGTRGSTT